MSESTPPIHRTSPLLALMILALTAGLFTIGTGFGKDAWEGWSLSQDAPGFETMQGTIKHARTRSEGQDHVTDVAFRYVVDGERYEGDNKATARSYRDAMLASRDANRYKVNQKVKLFVDPERPERATLSREVPTSRALVRSVYAALFYGIGIFTLITFWRSRKRSRVLAYAKHLEQERQADLEQRRLARHVEE
jgi:hypothetical protein